MVINGATLRNIENIEEYGENSLILLNEGTLSGTMVAIDVAIYDVAGKAAGKVYLSSFSHSDGSSS